jgi:hypothetical protein
MAREVSIGASEVRANSGATFGPSGVRALPLAAGINEGGHYFTYYSALVVFSCSYHRC